MNSVITIILSVVALFSPPEVTEAKDPPPARVIPTPPIQVLEEIDFLPYEIDDPKEPPEDVRCFCVMWLREVMGVDIKGDAWTIKANSRPTVGSVALFSYTTTDHAALVTELLTEGFMVREANHTKCEVTERFISYDDPFLRGFYKSESPSFNTEAPTNLRYQTTKYI